MFIETIALKYNAHGLRTSDTYSLVRLPLRWLKLWVSIVQALHIIIVTLSNMLFLFIG